MLPHPFGEGVELAAPLGFFVQPEIVEILVVVARVPTRETCTGRTSSVIFILLVI